jgi:hypothetical protein
MIILKTENAYLNLDKFDKMIDEGKGMYDPGDGCYRQLCRGIIIVNGEKGYVYTNTESQMYEKFESLLEIIMKTPANKNIVIDWEGISCSI